MRKTFLVTVATAALTISGAAFAQAPGGATQNAPTATQTSPATAPSAPAEKSAPMKRGDSDHMGGSGKTMPGNQAEQMKPGERGGEKNAQDMNRNEKAGGKKASESTMERSKEGTKSDQKNAGEMKSGTTTGQAASGAKLTTEQRTEVRSVITKQNVRPVTNVNFSISIGTRVPRTVAFHPLPAEVVTIYPDWRGYEFFLVSDQIVVVNPRTLEIVAVLDA